MSGGGGIDRETTTTLPGDEATGETDTTQAGGDDALTEAMQIIAASLVPQQQVEKNPPPPQPITGEQWTDRAWGIDQDPNGYDLYPTPSEQETSRTMYESGRPRGAPTSRIPQYSTTSPLDILNRMSAPELAALELQMMNAGYFEEDKLFGGQRAPLISDFTSLISQADANRIDWQDQLTANVDDYQTWKAEHPDKKPLTWAQQNPFIAPVFVKPDYATLAQRTKAVVRRDLGRAPTTSEMKLLTTQLGSDYQAEWQAEVYDTAKMDWEARSRAHEAKATSATTGAVQGVDPEARFEERFEDRYENELEHRQRVDTSRQKTTNLFDSLNTITRMTS